MPGVYYEANKGISKLLYSRSPLPTLTFYFPNSYFSNCLNWLHSVTTTTYHY